MTSRIEKKMTNTLHQDEPCIINILHIYLPVTLIVCVVLITAMTTTIALRAILS